MDRWGLHQRGKVIAAQVEHLTDMGNDLFLHIPTHNSKIDHAIDSPIKDQAARALLSWMAVASIKHIVKNHCKAIWSAQLAQWLFTGKGTERRKYTTVPTLFTAAV